MNSVLVVLTPEIAKQNRPVKTPSPNRVEVVLALATAEIEVGAKTARPAK